MIVFHEDAVTALDRERHRVRDLIAVRDIALEEISIAEQDRDDLLAALFAIRSMGDAQPDAAAVAAEAIARYAE